ncbi:hypothetical protein ABBQ32_010711 [Trebouxia sp. C0010 RCD-2024]
MAAHIATDTVCLTSLTSCSYSHNHVKPAVPLSQRLTQRRFDFVSSQQTCRIPRRRLRRASTQIVARAAEKQRSQTQVPEGYVSYETMIVLRPDMNDESRDVELAKFEAFLNREQCKGIKALVRGRQQLAYPIKGFWEGIYVLYTYSAKRTTSQKVQKHLSTPIVGGEANVLRHMTFRTS